MNSSTRSKRNSTVTICLKARTRVRFASVRSRSTTAVGPSTWVWPDGLGPTSGSCPPQCSTIFPPLKRNRSKAMTGLAKAAHAFVLRMKHDDVAIHDGAIDRNVGGRGTSDLGRERLQAG